MQEFKRLFALFDQDGDGSISKGELGDAMRRFGRETSDAELSTIMNSIDQDGSNMLDLSEFVCMLTDTEDHGSLLSSQIGCFRGAFALIAAQDSERGFDEDELRGFLSLVQEEMTDQEAAP